jgi:hypothetical protein
VCAKEHRRAAERANEIRDSFIMRALFALWKIWKAFLL